jgi:hypothetical protein
MSETSNDPDDFRVTDQLGVIHGFVSDDWPRFKPEDLRALLREVWNNGHDVPDDSAREAYILALVPLRSWERGGA